jgi:hypothetical protein
MPSQVAQPRAALAAYLHTQQVNTYLPCIARANLPVSMHQPWAVWYASACRAHARALTAGLCEVYHDSQANCDVEHNRSLGEHWGSWLHLPSQALFLLRCPTLEPARASFIGNSPQEPATPPKPQRRIAKCLPTAGLAGTSVHCQITRAQRCR